MVIVRIAWLGSSVVLDSVFIEVLNTHRLALDKEMQVPSGVLSAM